MVKAEKAGEYLKKILVMFIIMNAVFWGFATHKSHCSILPSFIKKCPPHWAHLLIGFVLFGIGIVVHNFTYLRSIRV